MSRPPRTRPSDLINWTPDQPLPSNEEELFCCYVMQGESANAAAGRLRLSRARTLSDHVQARLRWMRERFLSEREYDIQRWLESVVGIAETKLTDVVEWGWTSKTDDIMQDHETGQWVWIETGEPVHPEMLRDLVMPFCNVKDSTALTEAQKHALKELELELNPVTGHMSVKVKLRGGEREREMLGKFVGAFESDGRKNAQTLLDRLRGAETDMEREQIVKKLPSESLDELRRIAFNPEREAS